MPEKISDGFHNGAENIIRRRQPNEIAGFSRSATNQRPAGLIWAGQAECRGPRISEIQPGQSHSQSEISNSSCIGSMIIDIISSHRSRFALPYLMPFTFQFALMSDAGTTRSTMMPTNPVHCGSLAMTAFVMATSRAPRDICERFRTGVPS